MWAPLHPPPASACPVRGGRVVLVTSSRLAPSPLSAPRLFRDEGDLQEPQRNEPAEVASAPPEIQHSKPRRVSRRNAGARTLLSAQREQQEQQQQAASPKLDELWLPLQPTDESASQQQAAELEAQQRDSKLLETRMHLATSRRAALEYATQEHPSSLQPAQLVFVCSHVAKMCDPAAMTYKDWMEVQAGIQRLLTTYPGHVDKLNAYEYVVLLTSLARSHYTPSTEWLERYFVASLPHLPMYGPGYIYLLLRALGRMELQLWQLKTAPTFRTWMHKLLAVAQSKVWAYRGDELVRTLSAVSHLKWQPSDEWLAAFSLAIRSRLEFLDPPLLSQAMVALSAQRKKPEPGLMSALFTQLSTKLPMFDDRDLASTAQAVGLVRRFLHADFFCEFMVEVAHKVHSFTPASLTYLLAALAGVVDIGHMSVLSPHHQAAARANHRRLRAQQAANHTPAAAAAPSTSSLSSYDESDGSDTEREKYTLSGSEDHHNEATTSKSNAATRRVPPLVGLPGDPLPVLTGITANALAPAATDYQLQAPHGPPRRAPPPPPADALGDLRPVYPDLPLAGDWRLAQGRGAAAAVDASASLPGPRGRRVPLPAASPAWLRVIATRLYECLPEMSPSLSSVALRGLTTLGHQLDPAQMDIFFQANLPLLKQGRTEHFVNYVQALAASGYQPHSPQAALHFQTWYKELCRLAGRRQYSPNQVCDIVSGLAALPIAPPEQLLTNLLTHTRKNRPSALRHASPQRLARLITALRVLRYRPDFGFCHSFAQATRVHYAGLEPKELTAVLCGMAAASPSPLAVDHLWLSEMLLLVQCLLDRFDAGALTALLGGVLALASDPRRAGPTNSGAPSEVWCKSVFARLEEQARGMAAPHAANILWSAASILQQRMKQDPELSPPPLMDEHDQRAFDNLFSTSQQQEQPPQVLQGRRISCGASPQFLARLNACVSEGVELLSDLQLREATWALGLLGLPVAPQLAAAAQQAVERQQLQLEQQQQQQLLLQQQQQSVQAQLEQLQEQRQEPTWKPLPTCAPADSKAGRASKRRVFTQNGSHGAAMNESSDSEEGHMGTPDEARHVQANGGPMATNGVHVVDRPSREAEHVPVMGLRADMELNGVMDGAVVVMGEGGGESGWAVAAQAKGGRGRHAASSVSVPA